MLKGTQKKLNIVEMPGYRTIKKPDKTKRPRRFWNLKIQKYMSTMKKLMYLLYMLKVGIGKQNEWPHKNLHNNFQE